jgi:hypothetical protein
VQNLQAARTRSTNSAVKQRPNGSAAEGTPCSRSKHFSVISCTTRSAMCSNDSCSVMQDRISRGVTDLQPEAGAVITSCALTKHAGNSVLADLMISSTPESLNQLTEDLRLSPADEGD